MYQQCKPHASEPPMSITPASTLQPNALQITVPRTNEPGLDMLSPSSAVHATSNSEFSPQKLTQHIIPTEDPQCAMEIDDDEDDGVGDGIGEEDGDDDDDDENDDERNPADEDLTSPEKPPCIRDPFHPGSSELSKPESPSVNSEMCKVGHPSMQFARRFGSSSSPPSFSSRVVSPHQRHCTTLAFSCGTRRHCIKTCHALSATRSCSAMPPFLDPDDAST